jgi:hypothetical protein
MAKTNDPLRNALQGVAQEPVTEKATDDALRSEVSKLIDHLKSKGATADTQAKLRSGVIRLGYVPDEEQLSIIWHTVYTEALKSIFSRGLAFYNGKSEVLKNEFQLAAIRADEATEAYIAVRKVSPDPTKKELQDWQRSKSTNPLAKPVDPNATLSI